MYKYIVILFIVLFIWGFFIEPNLLSIKYYSVNFLKGKRIVFISDLHIAKNEKKRLDNIIRKINELNPDLVLCGGDYIQGHSGKNTMPIEDVARELAKIKAPVISVLGNHDGWYDKYTVQKSLEENGIIVLHNTNTKANGIFVAGIEDLLTGYPNVDAALENTESPRILLSHSPDIYFDVKEEVDLILAGHVHGGQVRIPFLGALICPSKYGTKFSCGDFKETQNRMIVTKGLGTSIMRVRFNNVPEIIVLQ